jgi:hypothetical protein
MSRTFRIKLGLEQLQHNGENICLPIQLAKILPLEDMKSLLRATLEKEGWKKSDQGYKKKLEGSGKGYEVRIKKDMSQAEVWILERTVAVEDIRLPQDIRQQVQEGKTIDPNSWKKMGISEDKGTMAIAAARTEINKALGKMYKEALMVKAQQLGTVESIQESENNEGTRIRITVQG